MAPSFSHRNAAVLTLSSILLPILFLSIPSASARPCKTLLISSYSFSIKSLDTNPNPTNFPFYPHRSSGFLIVADLTQETSSLEEDNQIFLNSRVYPSVDVGQRPEEGPLSSFRDRTKDILSVAVALLFGVGCGALTAATLYFVWSLFSTREEYGPGFDDDDDDVTPKKFGYVKIPAADPIPEPVKPVV